MQKNQFEQTYQGSMCVLDESVVTETLFGKLLHITQCLNMSLSIKLGLQSGVVLHQITLDETSLSTNLLQISGPLNIISTPGPQLVDP